jgi:hypothetical protein
MSMKITKQINDIQYPNPPVSFISHSHRANFVLLDVLARRANFSRICLGAKAERAQTLGQMFGLDVRMPWPPKIKK